MSGLDNQNVDPTSDFDNIANSDEAGILESHLASSSIFDESSPPNPQLSTPIDNLDLRKYQRRRNHFFIFFQYLLAAITVLCVAVFLTSAYSKSNEALSVYTSINEKIVNHYLDKESKAVLKTVAVVDSNKPILHRSHPNQVVNVNLSEKKEEKAKEVKNTEQPILSQIASINRHIFALIFLQSAIGLSLLLLVIKFTFTYRANVEDQVDDREESRKHVSSLLKDVHSPLTSLVSAITEAIKR